MSRNISAAEADLLFVQHQSDQEFYYQQLIQKLPVAIYTCDREGYVRFYNQAATELWGRAPVVDKDLWCGSWKIFDTMGRPVSLDDCPMAVALKEGKSVRGIEIVVERPDGVRVNVLPHPDPVFDREGRIIGAVNMLVDITEHKQAKQTNLLLKHYNDQLEQFAFAASHDMQEPLRKIQTFSTMLLERNAAQLDEQGLKVLNKITESAKRMNSIIEDLLSFSRETKPDDLMTETDLNRIIENIQSDLELLITSKQARIVCDALPLIHAIPSQMNRLFYNLVHNALKFSRQDEKPVIFITTANYIFSEGRRSYFEIVVSDNGIGFDQKYAKRVFELFQRLNDRHSYNGNGIGLALCKKIVENHNGSITASSEPGKGTSFSMRFPVELLAAR